MVSKKIFFWLFRPQFGPKIREGPSSPGTSPRSATAIERGVLNFAIAVIYHVGNYSAKNFRSDLADLYGCLFNTKKRCLYLQQLGLMQIFNIEINCCEPRLVSVSKRCM